MTKRSMPVFVCLLVISLLLAACGSAPTTQTPTAVPAADASAAPAAEASPSPAAEASPSPAAEAPEATAEATAAPEAAAGGIVSVAGSEGTTYIRNFNPFVSSALFPTQDGIYEPLMVFNSVKGELVPWLATGYAWSDDNTTLTVTLREGVQWSDGQPLTAQDVVFTFTLLKDNAALGGRGGAPIRGPVTGVTAPDATTVVFTFAEVDTQLLYDLLAQNIVPEHIWKDIKEPETFTNETPVASGPFTEVTEFKDQVYQLERNPNYWQAGKPAIQGLRFPASPGAEQSQLALINGDLDWASMSIPDIDTTFVAKNPEHHHYWFPNTGMAWVVYLNTTKPPFDDVKVRQAISQAIDRQQIVDVPMQGYVPALDATGLSDTYAAWKSADAVTTGAPLVTQNMDAANQLLDDAGYPKGADGMRAAPDGTPLAFEMIMISGWNDAVAASEVIVQNLQDIGIKAELKTGDWGFWSDKITKGEYDLSLGYTSAGATPYAFYRGQMASDVVQPVGEVIWENWSRYTNPEADALLKQFAQTADQSEQAAIAKQLQQIYATELPSLPLFPAPDWYEYNTSRFTGWPSAENPYANGAVYKQDRLIVMTTVEPVR